MPDKVAYSSNNFHTNPMKTLLAKIALAIVASIMLLPLTYASPIEDINKQMNLLLPRPGEASTETDFGDNSTPKKYEELKAVGALPSVTINSAMTTIIKTILGWAMIITLVAIVVTGIFYLISMGKEEDISKAKDIIIYLIIGMAIMAASYGIVSGISEFNFFNAPSQ